METLNVSDLLSLSQAPVGATGAAALNPLLVASSDGDLPAVVLKDPSHLLKIKDLGSDEKKFWILQWNAAQRFQAEQKKAIRKIAIREIGRQVEEGIDTFQGFVDGTDEIKELQDTVRKRALDLFSINEKISAHNTKHRNSPGFGHVLRHRLKEPKLREDTDWTTIKQSPALMDELAELYFDAYRIQSFRDDYLKQRLKTTLFNINMIHIIHQALKNLNKEIQNLPAVKAVAEISKSKNFATLEIDQLDPNDPKHGPLPFDENREVDEDMGEGEGSSDESDEVEKESDQKNDGVIYKFDKQKQELPKEIYNIRVRMGGEGGPIQRYVLSTRDNGPPDPTAVSELEGLTAELYKYCTDNKLEPTDYDINTLLIEQFTDLIRRASAAYDVLRATCEGTDREKQHEAELQYRSLRNIAIRLCCDTYQFPENLVDALVPSEERIVQLLSQQTGRPPPATVTLPPAAVTPPLPDIIPPQAGNSFASAAESQSKPKKKKVHFQGGIHAPPLEDSVQQCIPFAESIDIVEEKLYGQTALKRITGFRKYGKGNQLFLKSHGVNRAFKDRYIFEIVAAKPYGFSSEDCKMNLEPLKIVGKTYFAGKSWKELDVGGVADIRREKRIFERQGTVYILIKCGLDFAWINQNDLGSQFGKKRVEARAIKYRDEAGQGEPQLDNRDPGKRKKLRRRYIESDEEEEEGQSINVEDSESDVSNDDSDSECSDLIDDTECNDDVGKEKAEAQQKFRAKVLAQAMKDFEREFEAEWAAQEARKKKGKGRARS